MNNPPYRRSLRLVGVDYTGEYGYFITICAANRQQMFGAIAGGVMTLNSLGQIAEEELHAVTVHRPYVFLDMYVIMPDHMHAILFINHGSIPFSPSTLINPVDPQLAAASPINPVDPQLAAASPINPVDPQLAAASRNLPISTAQSVSYVDSGHLASSEPSDPVGPQQAADLQGVAPQSLSAIVRGYKSAVTRRANESALCPGGSVWQSNYYDHIIRDEGDLNAIRAYIETNPARWAEDHQFSHDKPEWNSP